MIAKYMVDLSNVQVTRALYSLDEPMGEFDYIAVTVINDQFSWRHVVTQILAVTQVGGDDRWTWMGRCRFLSRCHHMRVRRTAGYEADPDTGVS